MKKRLMAFAIIALCAISAFTLTGCETNKGGNTDAVKAAIEDAQKLTYDELLVKAKEEIGANKLQVYGNSSALAKALTEFNAATGIECVNNQMNDQPLYQKLMATIGANVYSADMVLIQDGNNLQNQMLNPGYLINYIPKDYKDVLAADDLNPTATIYLNKIFMYNNGNDLTNYLTNVWQLAGTSADPGHISGLSFKPASTENVNMNFLVMLTSPEWVTKLTAAYKKFYNKDYVAEAAYPNIGYKFIGEFIANSITHSSDGTAVKNVSTGSSGAIVIANYNKLKDVAAANLPKITVSAYEGTGVEGFDGFVYKMYSMVAKNAKYPYAACALVNYMLSTTGYNGAWGGLVGYYSTNPGTDIASGDKELAFWKTRCVIEDPAYVSLAMSDVYAFVTSAESKK